MKAALKIGFGLILGIACTMQFPMIFLNITLSKYFRGEVHIEKIHGGWLTPVYLEGVTVKTDDPSCVCRWENVLGSKSLLRQLYEKKGHFSGTCQLQMQGLEPLNMNSHVEIDFSQASLSLQMREEDKIGLDVIIKNGTLTLCEPFFFSNGPLMITISDQNFYIPINQLHKANIPKIQLILEKGAFLTSDFQSTPIDLSILDGVLQWERCDFLLGGCTYATWGKFAIAEDSIDAVLGISTPTDCLCQIPIKGPIEHLNIDLEAAKRTLTALMARKSGLQDRRMLKGKSSLLDPHFSYSKLPEIPSPPRRYEIPWLTKH